VIEFSIASRSSRSRIHPHDLPPPAATHLGHHFPSIHEFSFQRLRLGYSLSWSQSHGAGVEISPFCLIPRISDEVKSLLMAGNDFWRRLFYLFTPGASLYHG
jgi:hypothetical protein